MQGLIKTKHSIFIFRDDIAQDFKYFAWEIYADGIGFKIHTHKWNRLPKEVITLFNLECPPQTVSYLPILN